MTLLSSKTTSILFWIREFYVRNKFCPTFREVQDAFNYKSVSTVQYHVDKLAEAGLIISNSNKARTLRLADFNWEPYLTLDEEIPIENFAGLEYGLRSSPTGIPLVGEIAAGGFVEVFPGNVTDYVLRDEYPNGVGNSGRFALKVRGRSMINANILDGDIVILEKPSGLQEVINNSIVAARIEGENMTTLKRWHRNGCRVHLTPENLDYETLQIEPEKVVVEGIFSGLIIRENP
ncbi:MAG: transcriptional repressor LexA [Leptolyngbyaceae cyanobacterium]